MVGQRVRKRRRDLDMTQMQLAEKSGLKQFHISIIERSEGEIQTDTLRKLALALDTSADWLIGLQVTTREGD